ncbi:MAG: DsbC family protein [Rhizobacter sp.]
MKKQIQGWRKSASVFAAAAIVLASTFGLGAAKAQTFVSPSFADPAISTIQARLTQRLTGFPKIDEIRPSGMPGLYEVRAGYQLFYSDAQGNFLVQGELIDTRSTRNLTRERIDTLSAVDFKQLPFKDALVWKTGTGQRRIAVFADPNCPYCKKLETELQGLKDVTVYNFLYPVLAADSTTKSQAIWCSPDSTQAWRNWMLQGTPVTTATACANPLERNLAFGKAHNIQGVPAVFFEDGSRSPGFVSAGQIEAKLAFNASRVVESGNDRTSSSEK